MSDPIKKKPLVTVKAINEKILLQIYPLRGELNQTPDPLTENEELVGYLANGGGVVVRDKVTENVRCIWPNRYLRGIGMDERAPASWVHLQSLPQIFIA